MPGLTVRQLVTKWGFDADTSKVLSFQKAVKATKVSVKNVGIVLAGATAAAGFFAKRAGDIEQVQIAFETMLKSAEKGQALFEEIASFAAKTPFQLTGLVESSKRLLAFGFEAEQVIPTLSTLGDISAGVGRDKLPQLILALGQVRAATKLRGQELRQFTEAGVPLIEELAKQTGKAEKEIADLVSKGSVSFDDVNEALLNLTTGSGRFSNLMVKQSKTFLGLLSNIRDALDIISFEVGFELLPAAKKIAVQFLSFLDANRKLIALRLGAFFREMAQTATDLVDSFGGMKNTIKAVAIASSVLFAVWKPGLVVAGLFLLAIQDIFAAMKGQKSVVGGLITKYQELFDLFNKLAPFISSAGGAVLGAVAGAPLGPAGFIGGGIAGAVGGFAAQKAAMENLFSTSVTVNVSGKPDGSTIQEIEKAVGRVIASEGRNIVRNLGPQLER